jgi:hypothetical protein
LVELLGRFLQHTSSLFPFLQTDIGTP